jgi:hypothetical protein
LLACAKAYHPIAESTPAIPVAPPESDPQNQVTVFDFTNKEGCVDLGDEVSAKKPNKHSSSIKLYLTADCTGPYYSMSASTNQLHLVDENLMFVIEGNNRRGLLLKKVSF